MNKHNGSVLQNRSTRGMTGCRVLVSALAVCLLLSDMAGTARKHITLIITVKI